MSKYLARIDTDGGCVFFGSGASVAVRAVDGAPEIPAAANHTPDEKAAAVASHLTNHMGDAQAAATFGCDLHTTFFLEVRRGDARDALDAAVALLEDAISQAGGRKPKRYRKLDVREIPYSPADLNTTTERWLASPARAA